MNKPWRGVFPIVVTPFTKSYELDEKGLRSLVRFCLKAGVQGVVGPANASEFSTLSDDERKRWLEIVIGETGGQAPVIASTTSGHALPAIALSQYAQKLGANGVMSMPPHVQHPDAEGCYAYYKALSDALDIPIMVQNYIAPIGTPMSPSLLARMCKEIRQVHYIKEETFPSSRMLSLTIATAGPHCRGVFGGQGGLYLIDEYRRGSVGNMPACEIPDVQVVLWNRLEAGDFVGARAMFNRVLPLINYERQYGVGVYKELLYRRGVIETNRCRTPGRELDEHDRAEMDAILVEIEPLYTI
jgi:dihydrodipicolinate synthase/N-acetylneuraminate lyase